MTKNHVQEGSVTVFFTLLLGILVSLVGTSLAVTRNNAARVQILNGMDIGLYSVFSRYDKELFEKYDLLFLNMDSGTGGFSFWCDEFQRYMNQVLNQNYQKLQLEKAGISSYSLATDHTGELFYLEVVDYMKKMNGTFLVEEAWNRIKKETDQSQNACETWEKTDVTEALKSYDDQVQAAEKMEEALAGQEDEHSEEIVFSEEGMEEKRDEKKEKGGEKRKSVKNPIPVIKRLIGRNILSLILPQDTVVSGKTIVKNRVLSGRSQEKGSASTVSAGHPKYSAAEELLFREYFIRKFGNYKNPEENALSYEWEYLIQGKESDYDNLKEIAMKLLLIREGLNLTAILSDQQKMSEIAGMAALIAAAFLFPPAEGVIQTALVICWSFGESLMDLRTLFHGGKIPTVKNGTNWQLSLENLINVTEQTEKNYQEGLDYEDYLKVLLFMKNRSEITVRGMDLVELGMRSTGRVNFRLDHCVGSMEIRAAVNANRMKTYQINREFSYVN